MHLIPITFLAICVFGVAMAAAVVLSLISIYIPDRSRENIYRVSFAPMISQSTDGGPVFVKTGDFNNDSILDLAVANYNGNISILLGYGNGSFKHYIDLWSGSDATVIGIAIDDLNKDNRLDIVAANRKSGNISVFLGEGNGSFLQPSIISTGLNSTPVGLALHDLNNDTVLDLVVTDHERDKLHVFRGNGNGTFTEIHTLPTGNSSGPYIVITQDFNKDGRFDIAVGNGDGNNIGIFLGDGVGGFSQQTTYHINSGPYALVAADFNRDGTLDIATANYDGNSISILFGNGDGTFHEQYVYFTGVGSLPYAIALGDFNGDNITDIIVPNSGTDNVGIFSGYGNGRFTHQKTYSTGKGSGPVELTVGDFNGDNRLDFISANNNTHSVGIFLNTHSF